MKKKTYITPQTDTVCIENEGIICASLTLERGGTDDQQNQPDRDADDYWLAE